MSFFKVNPTDFIDAYAFFDKCVDIEQFSFVMPFQVNFMVGAALLIGGVIAILIACALLVASLKTALDYYLGLDDEEKKNEE